MDFFKNRHVCLHNNVPIDVEEAYCPDCGELIRNEWYIVRCSCCNIKRKAHIKYDEIIPDTNYCPNCGSTEFYVEELKNINFIDVHYAVFKKTVVVQKNYITRQIWVDEDNEEQRLLTANN